MNIRLAILASFALQVGGLFGAAYYAVAPNVSAATLPSVSAVLPDPLPVNQVVTETIAPRPSPVMAKAKSTASKAPKQGKVLACGGWNDSAVGGAYKRCEWQ